jgi:hypothetical protein
MASPFLTSPHKLTQIIATPLRKALGLGRFAAAHRVLWEYGLYDVVTLHLKLGVAALMRSQRCLSRGIELAGNLAFDFAGPQPDDTTKFCRPRAGIIKEMLTSLDLASAPTNLTDLKTALDKKARENYMSLVSPPTLALKPQLPPLPYLKLDSKPAVCIRARVRLGVSLSFDRIKRFKKRVDDLCDHCGRVATGTTEHLLLHCPAFQAARAACSTALAIDGFALSMDVLCGLLPDRTRKLLVKRAHEATASFLLHVSKRHFL